MTLSIYYGILFILGTIFGSFSSVLIERWKSGKGGILTGRSECPKCHRQLGFWELFPVLSYIKQGGKCAGCRTPIPMFYPILEIAMGLIFSITGYALYNLGYIWIDWSFWLILSCAWATGIYIFYDIRYLEIPDQIIVPFIYLCISLIVGGYFFEPLRIFHDIDTYHTYHTFMYDHIFGAILLYSFFYFQILIPGGFYLLKRRDFKNFGGLILSYFSLPILMLTDFFQKKKDTDDTIDIPTWIGGGDLRIALFIGLTLGSVHGISSFFFAYILGSIFGMASIGLSYSGITKRKKEIAFGPFLGVGWVMSLVYYNEILDFLFNRI